MPFMLIDSHCHLDKLDTTDRTLSDYLQAAQDRGVGRFLSVSVELDKFSQLTEIADRFPQQVLISAGHHPNDVEVNQLPLYETLVAQAQHPAVCALGETGLDYYYGGNQKTLQQQYFREHIRAAHAVKKPLIIHTRSASEDTLQILKEENADQVGGVFHCFTENWETAEEALKLGFYISFSGIVTFKNATALQEVAKKVPIERLLVETDSPYLAPVPYRGKPNEPAYVYYVAEFIAALRGISLEELARRTSENFERFISN